MGFDGARESEDWWSVKGGKVSCHARTDTGGQCSMANSQTDEPPSHESTQPVLGEHSEVGNERNVSLVGILHAKEELSIEQMDNSGSMAEGQDQAASDMIDKMLVRTLVRSFLVVIAGLLSRSGSA
jgi:hypothetical protein